MHSTDMGLEGEGLRVIAEQLDSFHPSDLFLGRYRMLGREERRRGGAPLMSVWLCLQAERYICGKQSCPASHLAPITLRTRTV